jgi:hypothetical protein
MVEVTSERIMNCTETLKKIMLTVFVCISNSVELYMDLDLEC